MFQLHCNYCKKKQIVTAVEIGSNCGVQFKHVHCTECHYPIAMEAVAKPIRGC